MIREFRRIDLRRLKGNEFSGKNDIGYIFDPEFYKHTLVDRNDEVKAIIFARPYWKKNFIASFLISENINLGDVRELKKFLYQAIEDIGVERIQTDSIDCPVINRWHTFLGFTLEGKREKMAYDKDFNMWGLLKGRDFK